VFRAIGRLAVGAAALVTLAACSLPFGLGQPSVRALNSGTAASLDAARSFRLAGTYTESGKAWKVDLELVRPATAHVLLSGPNDDLEAIIITDQGSYFRGQKFLSDHMGSDPLSRSLVQATGSSWWTGLSATAPDFPDFTKGSSLAATFMGTAVTSRTDHVPVGVVQTVRLSGPRADVFVAETPPYRVVRIHMKAGAIVDGVSGADFLYSDFGRDFAIAAPSGAVNFADLSTLPPVYTVVSVDTSGCLSTCVVGASLKNLGGRGGARAPSTVTFTITDPQTSTVLGTCTVTVQPDVVHSATTNVFCTISGVNGGDHNAAVVTAAADNPGHA
jgi:hypothetical protein